MFPFSPINIPPHTHALKNLPSKEWLSAFEGGLFEEEDGEEKEERCRAAVAFAAKRREKGWRLTHEELYDVRRARMMSEVSKGCFLRTYFFPLHIYTLLPGMVDFYFR